MTYNDTAHLAQLCKSRTVKSPRDLVIALAEHPHQPNWDSIIGTVYGDFMWHQLIIEGHEELAKRSDFFPCMAWVQQWLAWKALNGKKAEPGTTILRPEFILALSIEDGVKLLEDPMDRQMIKDVSVHLGRKSRAELTTGSQLKWILRKGTDTCGAFDCKVTPEEAPKPIKRCSRCRGTFYVSPLHFHRQLKI